MVSIGSSSSVSGGDDANPGVLKSQKLLANPEQEICNFSNSEIEAIKPLFPEKTIFKTFDPLLPSDATSADWVCFSAAPFLIGFEYPFPDFTNQFFEITGLSFAQTMPMIWRTLFVIEELIRVKGLELKISDLPHLYQLTTHGSSRFLFKIKPHHDYPILKTTQNDPAWKHQFFFVKRNSIPGGESLPLEWVKKVDSFKKLAKAKDPDTDSRITALLALDPFDRTFKFKNPLSQSAVEDQGSHTMSTSKKSAGKFALEEIENRISRKPSEVVPIRMELTPDPRPLTTRAKSTAGKKRKAPDSHLVSLFDGKDPFEVEKQLHVVLGMV